MEISKKTQTIIGVVVVGFVGYWIWKKNQTNSVWANAGGKTSKRGRGGVRVPSDPITCLPPLEPVWDREAKKWTCQFQEQGGY